MSEATWLRIFGDNLLDMLGDRGMTQKDLAEESGLSEGTISKYLCKKQMPGVKALINISHALDCTLDELMDFGDTIV